MGVKFTCHLGANSFSLIIILFSYAYLPFSIYYPENYKLELRESIMLNQAIILGNLGADPDQRQTQKGTAVTNFTVATSRQWKDGNGQQQTETEWHRIVTFGKLAEICGQYLTKGSKVYIEGRIQTRQWEDQNGFTRSTTEIVAKEMKMLDSKQQGNNNFENGFDANEPPF